MKPNTSAQIARSAKTWNSAPKAASARARVFAGSQPFTVLSIGAGVSGVTESTIVENSVRDLMPLICAVSCST